MWLFAVGAGGLTLLIVSFLLWFRTKGKSGVHYNAEQKENIAGIVAEVLPLHASSGWVLQGGHGGLRLFSRHLNALQLYSRTGVVAASLIVDVSAKRALSLVTSLKELPCWFFGLPSSNCSTPSLTPSLLKQPSLHSHVLQFTMRNHPQGLLPSIVWSIQLKVATWIAKYAPAFEQYVSAPQKIKTESLERYWCSRNDGLSYVFSQPRGPSSFPFSWCSMYFASLRQPGVCLVTMVMCPSQPDASGVSDLVTGQLCALREHITMRSFKVYSRHRLQPHHLTSGHMTSNHMTGGHMTSDQQLSGEVDSEVAAHFKHVENAIEEVDTPLSSLGATSLPPAAADASPQASLNPAIAALSPEAARNTEYLNLAEECTNKLLTMAREDVSDGWLEVGTTKNVRVMKKLPKGKGEPPVNSIKGSGTVKAPPDFLLRVLTDPANTTQLDDMLREMRVVEQLSPGVTLVQLLYKPVWPTTARDISVLSIAGQVGHSTWVSSGTSISDPRIPEEKGHVRADLIGGGYVLESIPEHPEWSAVTYSACINLKGSIPAFVVNKIAESQPMCVNHLRNFAEPLYHQMKREPQKLAAFEKQFPTSQLFAKESATTTAELTSTQEDSTLEVSTAQLHLDSGDHEPANQLHGNHDQVHDGHDQLHGGHDQIHGDHESATQYNESARFQTPPFDSGDEINDIERKSDAPSFQTASLHNSPAEAYQVTAGGSSDAGGSGSPVAGGSGSVAAGRSSDAVRSGSPAAGGSSEAGESGSVAAGGSSEAGESSGSLAASEADPSTVEMKSAALQLSQYTPKNAAEEQQLDSRLQSITKENIYYPRHDSGEVDYRTMANQTAARVLEEVFHVSGLDILDSATNTSPLTGGWRFEGMEKDVVLLSKTTPNQPFSSIMGKGVIPLSPDFVFNSLRNPQLRFMYDNMLKELHIVKHLEDGLYVLHLHHETTQCFIKQARDFCILVNERSEPNKKMLTGISVETADCPPNSSLHRGKIHCSGWVVEPIQVQGKLCTEITYLLQVDMGGVPSALMNFISKRQPLAVAYLREYLVSTSLEQSQTSLN